MTLFNNGINNTLMNITFETFVVIERMIYFKVKVAANKNDQNYQKDLIATVIDVKKFIKGIYGNFFVKSFAADYMKSIDFVPEFPMPIV